MPEPVSQHRERVRHIIVAVFFVTGACGLVYEVIAMRLLRLVMGNTTFAVTAVLCAFMTGLALGSVIGGRVAEKRSNLLRLFAFLQMGIAVLFLAFPCFVSGLTPVCAIIYRHIPSAFVLGTARFILASVALVLPCVLMGASLPILVRCFAESVEAVGRTAGVFYSSNTLGAALGAWLAGFVLIPHLGVRHALWLTCCVSFVAGSVVFFLRSSCSVPELRKESPVRERRQTIRVMVLIVGYGIAGFAALAYEVAWTRALTLLIGSSVYAFSLILTAFILGLGVGSASFSRLAEKTRDALLWLALTQCFIGISALAVVPLIDELPFRITRWLASTEGSFVLVQGAMFGVMLLIMIAPTFLMGAAFPFAAQQLAMWEATSGRSVGTLCSVNTLGCIVGSAAAGFLLIPWIGIERTIVVAVCLNLFVGVVFMAWARRASFAVKVAVIVMIVLGAVVAVDRMPEWDVYRMTSGPVVMSRTLSPKMIDKNRVLDEKARANKIIYHDEGVSATVTVKQTPAGERVLFVNGKPDASSLGDLPTQVMIGHLPVLLHRAPRKVLVIGLASGITLGSVACHDVVEIDCVEICPEMLSACRYFDAYNHSVMDDPRVNVVIADARTYLAMCGKKYDVIISEPTNPWISGVSDLFTKEFFELCRNALADNGVMCTWLEAYNLDKLSFRSAGRTFQDVFPDTTVWSPMGWDFLLVAHKDGAGPPFWDFRERMASPEVAEDLQRISVNSPAELLGYLVLGSAGAHSLWRDAPVHTDDNALLEFRAPRTVIRNDEQIPLKELIEDNREAAAIFPPSDKEAEPVMQKAARYIWGRGHTSRAEIMLGEGRCAEAFGELRAAVAINRNDPMLRRIIRRILADAVSELNQGNLDGAGNIYRDLAAVDDLCHEAYYGLGYVAEKEKRYEDAMKHYQAASVRCPSSPAYRVAIAELHDLMGNREQAIKVMSEAVILSRASGNRAFTTTLIRRLQTMQRKVKFR